MSQNIPEFDLCVIGGGINGAAIARDAAGRGLSVLLLEQNDLASATSSASTKLIHGGLRYLEYFEFKLVHEALKEREVLLAQAPHIMWPLSFVLPHDNTLRPAWMIRIGLFLYDHLGGTHTLPSSRGINLRKTEYGTPLQKRLKKGFIYADGWVDDARFVILNALDAQKHGAEIRSYTKCTKISAKDDKSGWLIRAQARIGEQQEQQFSARLIVNAAGPWVRSLLDDNDLAQDSTPGVRLVKGSHIIVPRLFEGSHAYILQQPDKRIVFTIPYQDKFTLIGTTDVEVDHDPSESQISDEEITYLCEAVNRSFQKQITAADVVSTYSGVRPLLDDHEDNASAVTRDYKLILDDHKGPALLSVFGGKITTARKLAENAVDELMDYENDPRFGWTKDKSLPGGDIKGADFDVFLITTQKNLSGFSPALIARYAHAYGTRINMVLGTAKSEKDLGTHYGDDIYEAEIDYLITHEWARTVEDILWRRSKCGLHITPQTVQNLEQALTAKIKN